MEEGIRGADNAWKGSRVDAKPHAHCFLYVPGKCPIQATGVGCQNMHKESLVYFFSPKRPVVFKGRGSKRKVSMMGGISYSCIRRIRREGERVKHALRGAQGGQRRKGSLYYKKK
eukprot:763858-Hanusia_phi.AAC.2